MLKVDPLDLIINRSEIIISGNVGTNGMNALHLVRWFAASPKTISRLKTFSTLMMMAVFGSRLAAQVQKQLPPPSVSPGTVSLYASQVQQFAASMRMVKWSLSPSVGTISSAGLYTAPTAISSQEVVTVTATSAVQAKVSASATVNLWPAINVSVAPGSASLLAAQTQQFTATVANTPKTAVAWSLSPAVGAISNTGLYTAPASISSPQAVTVTATSAADPTKSATATVNLWPPVSVSVAPPTAKLYAAQTQQFTASVTNSPKTAVTWSLSPAVGAISNAGLYTAPASISASQAVTVTATSAADPTKSATATVNLWPPVNVSVAPPTAKLYAAQTQQFTATVTNSPNTVVTWSLSQAVGTISNAGLYTAPASISASQAVTVTATSAADPTKSATATVNLWPPVNVSVAPPTATLYAAQTQQFTATLTNTPNSAVTWSLSTAVGTISNTGLYSAPASISASQTVTVTATSAADPTKSTTATVTLKPLVVTTINPQNTQLAASQMQQFQALVTGTSNSSVTWSINPSIGTISSNGVYTAPASITSYQTVNVTAASLADPTSSASAIITLSSLVSVTIGPQTVNLSAYKQQQFQANVSGATDSTITWTISPTVGTISNSGLYTAPPSITGPQTITLTATSAADPTKYATAIVSLTQIVLPIEVIGPNGNIESVDVTIPAAVNLAGLQRIFLQMHSLRYADKASVQVNNSPWVPLDDGTVTYLDQSLAYGGMGGGFNTHKMTVDLPAGTLVSGRNTVRFQFNQLNLPHAGVGFRVLKFNFLQSDGSKLLPSNLFVDDDPNQWQPPLTSAADIAAGKQLFQQAAILHAGVPVKVHCNSCHTQDGRDMKYFNYSNKFIHYGALISGLTDQQGDQIASYIRSLNVPNPGRPWNPPYQPGPGLDSQPVINWAAGAGIDAVLDDYGQMLDGMFPAGIQDSMFSANANLNIRETAVPLQMPDWNHWLPTTHPIDAYGDAFTTNGYYTIYQTIRSNLKVGDANAYAAQVANFNSWANAGFGMYVTEGTPEWNNPALWTPDTVNAMMSLQQWGAIKTWEMMHEFELEGFGQQVFASPDTPGPQRTPSLADQRAWYSGQPWRVSPNILKMPAGVAGLGNGSYGTWLYDAYIWYHLQLILNNSNHQQQYMGPIDWGYSYGFVMHMGVQVPGNAILQMMWSMKALQISNNGLGPELGGVGWQWMVNHLGWLFQQPAMLYEWQGVPADTRSQLLTGILRAWLAQVRQFTPQQFYTGGWTTPTDVPTGTGSMVDWIWALVPRFKSLGVDPTLMGQTAQWAQSMWPDNNWTADLNATCAPPDSSGVMVCTQ